MEEAAHDRAALAVHVEGGPGVVEEGRGHAREEGALGDSLQTHSSGFSEAFTGYKLTRRSVVCRLPGRQADTV